jgi:uncharacterized protein involved in outer membrane biogenesis
VPWWLLGAGALLLGTLAALPLLIDPGWLAKRLEPRASAALGREVSIAGARIRWLPRPSLTATDVRIAGGDTQGALFAAQRLAVAPDLSAALGGDLVADRVELDGARLTLAATTDDDGGARPWQPVRLATMLRRLREVRLRDARLRRLDADGETAFALRLPRLRFAGGDLPWRLELQARHAATATIRAAAALRRDDSGWRLADIALDGDGWRVRGDLALRPGLGLSGLTAAEWLDGLCLVGGELDLRHAASETRVTLRPRSVEQPASGSVRIAIAGQQRNRPIDGALTLQPLAGLVQEPMAHGIALALDSRSVELRADSTPAKLGAETASADLRVAYASTDDLAAWLPFALPDLPPGRLDATLEHGTAWRLRDIDAEIGATRVNGELRVDPGEPGGIHTDLRASRLALDELLAGNAWDDPGSAPGPEPAPGPDPDALAGLPAIGLRLDADRVTLPGGREFADLRLDAELRQGRLELAQLDLAAGGGHIRAEGALDLHTRPATGELRAQVDGLRLARPWGPRAQRRLGRLSAQLRLEATDAATAGKDRDRRPLPWLGRLRLQADGRLRDAAGGDLTLSLHSEDAGGANAGGRGTAGSARGDWRGTPLRVEFEGDSLLAVRDPETPYDLRLALDYGDSRILAEGSVTDPTALAGVDLALTLEGPNPQRLYRLLGLPLPALPPYRFSGHLGHSEQRWALRELSGHFGDSDLAGQLSLDLAQAPPMVRGELRSQALDLDDLGLAIGLPPAVADDDAAAAQQQDTPGDDPDTDVLPQRRFALERLGGLAARIDYRAARVQAGDLPLDALAAELRLDGTHLRLDPLDFRIGDGQVRNRLTIEAGTPPLAAVLETELRGVDLARALRDLPLADDSRGILAGEGKLWLQGLTTAELLASADGGLTLLMTGGGLDAQLVEQAGLDLGETVLAELFERPAVAIDCAYADLQFRAGRMRLAQAVIDTADTLFRVDGTVDFGDERLDLVLHAHPKDVSAPSWRSPLRLVGPFAEPALDIDTAGPVARTAAAAGLAALAGPVGALLPLLETGSDAESPYCEGLVERLDRAQRAGESQ